MNKSKKILNFNSIAFGWPIWKEPTPFRLPIKSKKNVYLEKLSLCFLLFRKIFLNNEK